MTMTRWAARAAGLALVLSALAAPAWAGASPPAVPEIDPGSVLSVFTLLSGGMLLLTDRRRKAKA